MGRPTRRKRLDQVRSGPIYYNAAVTIYSDLLTTPDSLNDIADPRYREDAAVPGNNGTVGKDAANVCDKSDCLRKKLCPRRIGVALRANR